MPLFVHLPKTAIASWVVWVYKLRFVMFCDVLLHCLLYDKFKWCVHRIWIREPAFYALQCSDFRRPRDISADWITGNIYWTDHSRMHWFSYYTAHWTKLRYSINVGQLKGPNCTRLITDIAGEPYAITVNPARGWVVYSDTLFLNTLLKTHYSYSFVEWIGLLNFNMNSIFKHFWTLLFNTM